jgi:hypothetical protein
MNIIDHIEAAVNQLSISQTNSVGFSIGEREFNNLNQALEDFQIWIDAPLRSNDAMQSGGALIPAYQIRMLFLKKAQFGNTYEQHYDITSEMRNIRREFILRLNKYKDIHGRRVFQNFTSFNSNDVINLFDANLSGILLEFDLVPLDEGSICTPVVLPAPSVYLFADKTSVINGDTVRLGWFAFNVNTITIDNGIGEVNAIGFRDVLITQDTTFTATATNESGTDTSSIEITVGVCLDATAVLKNTNGDTLSTTNIPSGDTVDVPAPDATAILKNTQGTTLSSTNIPSGNSEDITAPDAAVENSNQSYQNTVASGDTLVLPDITVTDSEGSTYQQPSVEDVVCTPQVKEVFIKGIFASGNSQMEQLTIDADNAGTYTSITDDGGSGTISLEINGSPATLPFTLNIGDTLDAERTSTASLGFYKILGSYV